MPWWSKRKSTVWGSHRERAVGGKRKSSHSLYLGCRVCYEPGWESESQRLGSPTAPTPSSVENPWRQCYKGKLDSLQNCKFYTGIEGWRNLSGPFSWFPLVSPTSAKYISKPVVFDAEANLRWNAEEIKSTNKIKQHCRITSLTV